MQVRRILGIDPGSRLMGYGMVDIIIAPGRANQIRHVTHGTLRLSGTGGRQEIALEERLLLIHEGLQELISKHRPTVMAIEKVFFAKNAVSALKLGQARGATILSGKMQGLEIFEYSPSEVKATVTGYGAADKSQVAKMVQVLVGVQEFTTSDASDGLALAICHAYRVANLGGSKSVLEQAYGRKRKSKSLSLAEAVGISPRSRLGSAGPRPGKGKTS